MKRLKFGAILLSIWSGANLLVALGVTAMTLAGKEPPALSMMLSSGEIQRLDAKVLAVINAQAILANPCIAALSAAVLAIVWTSLVVPKRWAFWALVGSLVPLQMFAFLSDAFLAHRSLVANLVSSALLLTGLGLVATDPSLARASTLDLAREELAREDLAFEEVEPD